MHILILGWCSVTQAFLTELTLPVLLGYQSQASGITFPLSADLLYIYDKLAILLLFWVFMATLVEILWRKKCQVAPVSN